MFQTVADLGSEVTVMKGQFDSFSKFVTTAETKLEELSNQVTNGSGMVMKIRLLLVSLNVWTSLTFARENNDKILFDLQC